MAQESEICAKIKGEQHSNHTEYAIITFQHPHPLSLSGIYGQLQQHFPDGNTRTKMCFLFQHRGCEKNDVLAHMYSTTLITNTTILHSVLNCKQCQ